MLLALAAAAVSVGRVSDGDTTPMGGLGMMIEADETYIGGKTRNMHISKRGYDFRKTRKQMGPRLDRKQAVVSLVERGGNVRSFHVAKVTGETLRSVLVTNADRDSYLMSDERNGYKGVGKEFLGHGIVVHSKDEYARRGGFHTNTIEGFFSLLSRGIVGTYYHLSEQHLHRYTAEFDFRYNTRKMNDFERAEQNLLGTIGKRLTYQRTVLSAA